MKQLLPTLLALAGILALTHTVHAEGPAQISGHGFTDPGTFRLTLSGAADLEASADLQTWTRIVTVAQPTGIEDFASRQADHRFYRLRGSSNLVGYVKVTVPPGKLVLLGNSFATALRLDSPEARHAVFGISNPPVKISLYTNGNFVAHSLDTASGKWEPSLRGVRAQEGFALQNMGQTPLTVRLSGPVRHGPVPTPLSAGASLVAAPFPNASPTALVQGASVPDGTQVLWFDEASQGYQTSSFNGLETPGKWEPKLPNVQPGRAVIIKAPKAVTLTNSLPAAATR